LWSVVLAQQGYRVLGIDLSPRMIVEALDLARECRLSEDMVRFSVGDVERLDVPNATCDAIVCRNVLDFVPSPALALRELQRVLKPGGHLVLATLGAYSPVKRESWRRFLPGAVSTGITNHILPWEMEALLRELGWEVVAREACFGPSVSGQVNAYTTDSSCHLKDPVLLQSVATSWEVVTR
jgi:SAM-dependent methyltransferase